MNYDQIVENILKSLEKTKFAVLATSSKEGIVSASQMTLINDGLTLYFQTDGSFEKVQNIKENPNVAINIGSIYFKGKAKIIGHPSNNPIFIDKLKKQSMETYESYSNLPSEVLIQVTLLQSKIWGIDNEKDIHHQETIQIVNFKDKTIDEITCARL